MTGAILFTFDGDLALDQLGFSVSGAGEVNGDGYSDLIVGAPQDSVQTSKSGSARVFSGRTGTILFTFDGDSADDKFGTSVSGAGNVDGDGFSDLIVGAEQDDNNAVDSGSARVFSGRTGAILRSFDGDSAGDLLGGSVSGAGDLNGNGLADVVVGARRDDNNNGGDSGSARIVSGNCGPVASFGSGCLGSFNIVPVLTVDGCATPGGSLELLLTFGLGGAPGFLLIGTGMGSTPIAGCTLLVDPVAATLPVTLLGGPLLGGFSLDVQIPLPSVTGVPLYVQVFVLDPGAANGSFSSSNGVMLTVE